MRTPWILATALLLTACAAEQDPTTLPPLTEEPSYPVFDNADRPPPNSLPARTVLQRFLRGAGADNPKVCTVLAPDQTLFAPTCPRWIAALSALDRSRLAQVKVPTATQGEAPREFVVAPSDLVWPAGAPSGLADITFTLTPSPDGWLLTPGR